MARDIIPPFSARNRGAQAQIDNDCPASARVGVVHILTQLVNQHYVKDWPTVMQELRRIDRSSFHDGEPLDETWEQAAERLLFQLPWEKVYDFCQRIYSHLAQDVWVRNPLTGQNEFMPKTEVQGHIAGELRLLFLEEHLALEFSDGIVRRRGRRHTADRIARAELVLGDPQLSRAREHYNKALAFFRNISKPDYENAVKEAVSAVEATAQVLFRSESKNLDDIIKSIAGNGVGQLPKPIAKTFDGLYGFRGSGQGVAHGTAGAGAGPATKEIAEYSLAVTASQIVLLVDLSAAAEPDVPF